MNRLVAFAWRMSASEGNSQRASICEYSRYWHTGTGFVAGHKIISKFDMVVLVSCCSGAHSFEHRNPHLQ